MSEKRILLGLTTTPKSNWRNKIKEIDELKLEEIALFLTGIKINDRKELYGLLEKSKSLKKIPHVHLRSDMKLEELDFLENKFAVEAFNIHSKNTAHYFSYEKYKNYAEKIFVENCEKLPEREELEKYGGLCIDFSHWQDGILQDWKDYRNKKLEKMIEEFPVGCCHISAVGKSLMTFFDLAVPNIVYQDYSKHYFKDLIEFDYMKKFVKYLPKYISLELENSFAEQLKVKKYIERIIN